MKKIVLLIMLLANVCLFAYGQDATIVREDRIWTYCFEDEKWGNFTEQYVNCKFDGTEKIGGRTYYKLNYWFPDEENPTIRTIAYMRESNGVVYVLTQQSNVYFHVYNIDFPVTFDRNLILQQNGEAKLYDFSRSSDDIFVDIVDVELYEYGCRRLDANYILQLSKCNRSVLSVKDLELDVYEINEIDNISDIKYTSSYNLKHNNTAIYAKGIGNIGRGLLHYMSRADWPTKLDNGNCYFVRQTDLYGNVLFDVSWLDGQQGVNAPTEQARPDDGKSYNLQGNPVENPEPGTIYIRDGEKHIAR